MGREKERNQRIEDQVRESRKRERYRTGPCVRELWEGGRERGGMEGGIKGENDV